MKTIVTYECQLCGATSENKATILACEAKGMPAPNPRYLIFSDKKDRLYPHITFCIADVHHQGHYWTYSLWAARDSGAGDSFGKELCGGGGCGEYLPKTAPARNAPHFKRMVAYVRSRLDVYAMAAVWDGKRAVPLDAFLRRSSNVR